MKKITLLLSSVCLATLVGAAHAVEATSDSSVQQQVDALKKQVAALEQQVQSADPVAATTGSKGNPRTSFVSIAPYIGIDSRFDGSELIVNQSSINDDISLLMLRKKVDDKLLAQGASAEVDAPQLTFSGMLEGKANYANNYSNDSTSDIDLADAELDSYLEINHWVSGYMTMTYDSGAPETSNTARVNNAGMDLGQGYVIFGNLETSPFYSSLGQMYVPFGQFSSYMVTGSFAKTLGRVKTRALNVGYMSPNQAGAIPFASAYVFKGDTNIDGSDSNSKVSEYGAALGLKYSKDKIYSNGSISAISNLAESQGMQGTSDASDDDFGGFAQTSEYENLQKRVPGLDVKESFSYGATSLLLEYVTATTAFDESDMMFNGEAAKPRAVNAELAYAFHWMKPSTVAVAYNHSWESLAVGLPQSRIAATYTINLWKHTTLSFEMLRDTGYSANTTAAAAGGAKPVNTDQLGETYNSFLLDIQAYF